MMKVFLRKFLLILFVSLVSCGKESATGPVPEAVKPGIEQFFQETRRAGKMEFGSLKLTKTITTDRTAWYKVGSRVAAYSYDIYLKAYVDMDELLDDDSAISVDEATKTITIKALPVRIEVAGRSAELRKEYEHIGLFRSRPDSRERAKLKEIANADFEKEMKGNPEYLETLRRSAGKKARTWLEAVGESRGYSVRFETPDLVNGQVVKDR